MGERRRPRTPSSSRATPCGPTYFLGGGHGSRTLPGGVSASPTEVPIVLSRERGKGERGGGRRDAERRFNCLRAQSRGGEGAARGPGGGRARGRAPPTAASAAGCAELGPDGAPWPPGGRARGPRAARAPRSPHPGALLGYLELSSAKWDPSPVLLTLQTAKHDSPPGRGKSVSLMPRRRLLLLAGPLRRRGEPPSRGAAEGGGAAGRLCKVWEEDEASGRPGRVRGLAGLSGGRGERGLGAAPRPGPACAEGECAAAAASHSFFFAAAAASGAADREAGAGCRPWRRPHSAL